MPGESNIPHERGKICDNGTAVETPEERRLPIFSFQGAKDITFPDGKEVLFCRHHDKKLGNTAADVCEMSTDAPSHASLHAERVEFQYPGDGPSPPPPHLAGNE